MKFVRVWTAEDGTKFDSRDACALYEAKAKLEAILGGAEVAEMLIAKADTIIALLRPYATKQVRTPRLVKQKAA